MLKKTITYTDYNDVERTETFWFGLSKAELTEMELSTVGGLSEMMRKIVATRDMPTMIKVFKDLILRSYGEKSPDGKRFIKSEELSRDFAQTEAYSILFMELASDDQAAADFVNGIIPKDVAAQLAEAQQNTPELTMLN